MKKIKNELPVESGTECTTEPVDAGRRQALARLGLTAAIAYAAPALLPLRRALAESGPGGGGDDSGGSNGGNDDGSGNSGHGGSDDGSGNPGQGGSDDLDDNSNPTEPTEATSPSE